MPDNSFNDLGFYKENTPNWLNYFASDWQRQQPGTPMAYIQPPRSQDPEELGGWQPTSAGIKNWDEPWSLINYNNPLAYLSNMKQGVDWGDTGPTGATWHGSDMSLGGQHLKDPWHPAYWWEDYSQLEALFKQLGLKVPSYPEK